MRKLIVVMALTLLAVPSFAGNGSIRRSKQPIKNSYIAVLESTTDADPRAVAEEVRAQHGIRVDSVWRLALRGFAFTGSEAAASRVSANPRVKAVWENEPTYPTGQQYPTPSWHLDRLDQRYWSWNDPTSPYYQNQTYDYYYTGAGVTAYVIDSGISPIASEFGNRILRQYNFATVNGVRDPNDFVDRCGHGTPVASILGGTAYGVAKDVNFVSLRTWGEAINGVCQGTTQDVIDALQQVIADHQQHGGLAVVNWSGRFPTIDGPGESAFKNVVEYGLPVVVSAGNDQADACTMSPGRLGHTS